MVWPISARGWLVTESVRGDGGAGPPKGKRYMFVRRGPDAFRDQDAETEEGGPPATDPDNNRRPQQDEN